MTFDEWFDRFEPIENKTGDSGLTVDGRCYFFETYKPDIDRVLEANKKDPGTVWTVIEGDDGELYVGDGYHIVNRIGYLITKKSYEGKALCFPYID